ncbi:MAG: hypothetical protein R2875_06540 [Desulfobacterales bacterium]
MTSKKMLSLPPCGEEILQALKHFFVLQPYLKPDGFGNFEISYLDKNAYQKLLAENHAIESKLFKYCESKQIRYEQYRPVIQGAGVPTNDIT